MTDNPSRAGAARRFKACPTFKRVRAVVDALPAFLRRRAWDQTIRCLRKPRWRRAITLSFTWLCSTRQLTASRMPVPPERPDHSACPASGHHPPARRSWPRRFARLRVVKHGLYLSSVDVRAAGRARPRLNDSPRLFLRRRRRRGWRGVSTAAGASLSGGGSGAGGGVSAAAGASLSGGGVGGGCGGGVSAIAGGSFSGGGGGASTAFSASFSGVGGRAGGGASAAGAACASGGASAWASSGGGAGAAKIGLSSSMTIGEPASDSTSAFVFVSRRKALACAAATTAAQRAHRIPSSRKARLV
jgi:hypothetical protein